MSNLSLRLPDSLHRTIRQLAEQDRSRRVLSEKSDRDRPAVARAVEKEGIAAASVWGVVALGPRAGARPRRFWDPGEQPLPFRAFKR